MIFYKPTEDRLFYVTQIPCQGGQVFVLSETFSDQRYYQMSPISVKPEDYEDMIYIGEL